MAETERYVIIPAYEPDEKLISLVKELHRYPDLEVIVVDDGSGKAYWPLFQQVSCYACVLEHSKNRGKGRAVKTAMEYIWRNRKRSGTIVIADGDGQHRPEDIRRVLEAAGPEPGLAAGNQSELKPADRVEPEPGLAAGLGPGLVLGSRCFTGKIPVRSKLGNRITCGVFSLVTGGVPIRDTQTGLRAFDIKLVPLLLEMEGERYEYEMNVLLEFAKRGIPFKEVPIQTVYLENNKSSHFRAIRDSARIYGHILKFACSSLASFLVDYMLFLMIGNGLKLAGCEPLAAMVSANIAARIVSGSCNFYWNRTYVFGHQGSPGRAAIRYGVLAAGILFINTCLLSGLITAAGLDAAKAKIAVELVLFVLSFLIQKFWIFKKERQTSPLPQKS